MTPINKTSRSKGRFFALCETNEKVSAVVESSSIPLFRTKAALVASQEGVAVSTSSAEQYCDSPMAAFTFTMSEDRMPLDVWSCYSEDVYLVRCCDYFRDMHLLIVLFQLDADDAKNLFDSNEPVDIPSEPVRPEKIEGQSVRLHCVDPAAVLRGSESAEIHLPRNIEEVSTRLSLTKLGLVRRSEKNFYVACISREMLEVILGPVIQILFFAG